MLKNIYQGVISLKIIVCGLTGKSTLGKALAEKLGFTFKDIEDYYFPNTNKKYKYENARTSDEVSKLLLNDLTAIDNLVLASVKCDYGYEIEKHFTDAVYIDTPKNIRMERIKKRSYEKFGERIEKGEDLYYRENLFFEMVSKRPEDYVKKWLNKTKIKVITIDGTKSIKFNLEKLMSEYTFH